MSVKLLRVLPTFVTSTVFAGVAVMAGAMMGDSAWAQTNPFLRQVDGFVLDAPPNEDFTIFPEDVLRERTNSFTDAVDRYQQTQRFAEPPISRPNLPTPYNTTLGSQAGYYQVTLSQPSLQFIRP
ncbi:MAG: hypothetical protein ACFCU9_16440 [Cyanophyceae cyanobacterium]